MKSQIECIEGISKMHKVVAISSLIFKPLMVFGTLSCVVMSIILLFYGKLILVLCGILSVLLSKKILGIFMIPFTLIVTTLLDERVQLDSEFVPRRPFVLYFYPICVMMSWSTLILLYSANFASGAPRFFVLLWSYFPATYPINSLALYDMKMGNYTSYVSSAIIDAYYLFMVIIVSLSDISNISIVSISAVVAIFISLIQSSVTRFLEERGLARI